MRHHSEPIRLVRADRTLVTLGVEETAGGFFIHLRKRVRSRPRCPSCGRGAVTLHSRYRRRLNHLPWLGKTVQLVLQVRRFRCRNSECPRRVFAEQVPSLAGYRARQTVRASDLTRRFAYALGGRPGARLLQHTGLGGSVDTVLRRLKAVPPPQANAVRVLGVDDWAWRDSKGTARSSWISRRTTSWIFCLCGRWKACAPGWSSNQALR
jgi:hypothetical protein